MAEKANISVSHDRFTCAICLGLLKEPVALACGHNYCLDCIKASWDQQVTDRAPCRCPQCRMTFNPRPVLCKNPLLAEMVEKLRAESEPAPPVAPVVRRPRAPREEVECTVCVGTKRKADKSCLDCLSSYCEAHFDRHEELHSGKRHKVVEAVDQLEDKVCSKHNKPLEVWCRTDQMCVCPLCIIDNHKGHDIIMAAAAKAEKRSELSDSFKKQITQREKELDQLRGAREPFKGSVKASLDASDKTFKELITFIETKSSELKELIEAQEGFSLSEADQLEARLEDLLETLKQKDDELEQLSLTEDPIHFLLNLPSQCPQNLRINIASHTYFDAVEKLLSNLKQHVSKSLQKDFDDTTTHVKQVFIEDTTRNDLMQHFHRPVVDEDKKFDTYHSQVMCKNVYARHLPSYWEVDWQDPGANSSVQIAVARDDVKRKGRYECRFGHDDQSWSLNCSGTGFTFAHNSKFTKICRDFTSVVGVLFDKPKQSLAFYGIYDQKAVLLHKVIVNTSAIVPAFSGCKWRIC